MPPFLGGGHMIARVGDFESTWAEPPTRSSRRARCRSPRRSGSARPSSGCAAIGMENVREHGRDVTGHAAKAKLDDAQAKRGEAARKRAQADRVERLAGTEKQKRKS